MSKFFGSVGSAEVAIQLQDGFNIGNHFDALDMENVKICKRQASGVAYNNVFTSGQWAYSVAGVDDIVGASNYIIAPNPAPSPPAGLPNFVAHSCGTHILSSLVPGYP